MAGTPEVSTSRSARVRRVAPTVAGLAISAIALLLVARSVDLAEAGRILASAAPGPLVVAEAVLFLGLAIRLFRWQVLLPPRRDGSRVGARPLLPILVVGYLGNAVLPARLGEVLRSYLVAQREQVAFGGALGSVLLERVVDTATLAVLAFIAAVGLAAAVWIVQGTGLLAAAAVAIVIVLAMWGFRPFVRLLERFGTFAVLRPAITTLVARLEQFVYWSGGAHRRRALGAAVVLSLGAWLCDATMVWLVGQSIGVGLPPLGAVLVLAITALATAIPSAPAYVGTFELAAVAAAGTVGVAPSDALALAVLAHGLALLPTIILGPLALASMGGGLRRLSQAAIEEQQAQEPGTT